MTVEWTLNVTTNSTTRQNAFSCIQTRLFTCSCHNKASAVTTGSKNHLKGTFWEPLISHTMEKLHWITRLLICGKVHCTSKTNTMPQRIKNRFRKNSRSGHWYETTSLIATTMDLSIQRFSWFQIIAKNNVMESEILLK